MLIENKNTGCVYMAANEWFADIQEEIYCRAVRSQSYEDGMRKTSSNLSIICVKVMMG